MRRDLFGILGLSVATVVFSFYYGYAYFNYDPSSNPPLNPTIAALNYVPLMFCIALLCVQKLSDSRTNAKFLVYGIGSVVWASISLSYFFRDVIHIIESKTLIISIGILCVIFGFVLYLYKLQRT